jgi:hypothetical protein
MGGEGGLAMDDFGIGLSIVASVEAPERPVVFGVSKDILFT